MLSFRKASILSVLLLLLAPAAVQAQTTHVVDYRYDAQGRLTHAVYDEAFTIQYTYDAAGNLTAYKVAEGVLVATEKEGDLPARFALHANYPNPFNPTTTLRFDLPEAAEVRVAVYDVLGREVLALTPGRRAAGPGRTLALDARALASGAYLYRITAEGTVQTYRATGRYDVKSPNCNIYQALYPQAMRLEGLRLLKYLDESSRSAP